MSTLYENFNTGDDDAFNSGGIATQLAQTFTPSDSHTITSVKLRLFKNVGENPGTITVKIYATDGSSHPTGAALATGTFDGNTLPTTTGTLSEITLGAGAILSASTEYAIVMYAAGAQVANWRFNTSGGYAGGAIYVSVDSGANWLDNFDDSDFMFEEYGDPAAANVDAPVATIDIEGMVPIVKTIISIPVAVINILANVPTLLFTEATWSNLAKNASSFANNTKSAVSTMANRVKESSNWSNRTKN
jgi:hypothetical protein